MLDSSALKETKNKKQKHYVDLTEHSCRPHSAMDHPFITPNLHLSTYSFYKNWRLILPNLQVCQRMERQSNKAISLKKKLKQEYKWENQAQLLSG